MGAQSKAGFGRREFLKGIAAVALAQGFSGASDAQACLTASWRFPKPHHDLQPHPIIRGLPGSENYWRNVRNAFLLPQNYIHMNTGTTGSQPLFSLANLGVYNLYKSMDPRDWEQNLNDRYPRLFPFGDSPSPTRGVAARQEAVANAYGANAEEIVLSYNTTDAMNLIFSGTPWQSNDRIITTTFEHSALTGPIAWARDYKGVEVAIIEIPSNFTASITVSEVLSWFEAELTKSLGQGNRQYVAFSEIFYKNGLRMPVKEICTLAHEYGAYCIVDTAHGWGQYPVNCHDCQADFVAGAGHKWLCGGPGTGIFYVRNSGADLPPFAMGDFSSYGDLFTVPSSDYGNRDWIPSASMQARGEINRPALFAMTDSLSFFTYIGLERIYERGVALGDYLKQKIEDRWGPEALWVQRNSDPAFATGITAFNPFKGRDKGDEFETMDSAITGILDALAAESPRIYIRSTTWRNSKTDSADNRVGFRVSTHAMYNNYKEIDHLFNRLVHRIDATGLPQLG